MKRQAEICDYYIHIWLSNRNAFPLLAEWVLSSTSTEFRRIESKWSVEGWDASGQTAAKAIQVGNVINLMNSSYLTTTMLRLPLKAQTSIWQLLFSFNKSHNVLIRPMISRRVRPAISSPTHGTPFVLPPSPIITRWRSMWAGDGGGDAVLRWFFCDVSMRVDVICYICAPLGSRLGLISQKQTHCKTQGLFTNGW